MSQPKLSSHGRKTTQFDQKSTSERFLGLSLAGGKTDKACLALIDYYPAQKKVFLSQLYHSIHSDDSISADSKITELILGLKNKIKFLAVDHPWRLPQCLRCQLSCPGYEACQEPHVKWFWTEFKKQRKVNKAAKIFTPYTQRCVETLISSQLETKFEISHALGANAAPLLARAQFLHRRTDKVNWIEVFPSLSVWRIGKHLKMKKSDLKSYRKSAVGESCRGQILENLQKHDVVFLYKEDVQIMIHSVHAFDAFICAYTAFLKNSSQTEKVPPNFPSGEDWIEFPLEFLKI
jgi:hypothetical protein